MTVNGKPHTNQATADTPLTYVLRNELGLHGPRFGCGLSSRNLEITSIDHRSLVDAYCKKVSFRFSITIYHASCINSARH